MATTRAPQPNAPVQGKPKRKPPPDSWATLRRTLREWDQPRLLGLVHDLFNTVPDARAAIVGRLMLNKPATAKKHTLDRLRAQVRKAVMPSKSAWKCNPNMRAARRVGDQYLRTTSDSDGAIALYIEMVEAAMELAIEICWDDGALYDSVERAAVAAEDQLPSASDGVLLQELATRTRQLLQHENFPGWGMDEVIATLAQALDQRAQALAGAIR